MNVRAFFHFVAARIGGSRGRLAACVILAFSAIVALPSGMAFAVEFTDRPAVKPGEQMLVEADQLVYDHDNNTVSAIGNVKIYYAGYTLEAERVTYLRSISKLIAIGKVKMTDPSGVVAYSNDIDITDDFRDGFVQSLRVDTPDNTHFVAESAQRTDGDKTVFVNGVYTACEPCKDHPEKPPLWQVKAQTIIVDQKTKTIYFKNSRFEFMGVPLAWIPYFSTADPSIKRKSGFLAPVIGYSEPLGASLATPYFLALAPNYDLTLTPTYYSNQGFLGQAEWRHRLSNGQYTIRVAGIDQQDPKAFLTKSGGGTFAQRDFRGGIRTTGEFDINRWWTFGWDGTLSTDRTFTRNYGVLSDDTVYTTSNVHLTGLKDKNYLDVRAEQFQVLTDSTDARYDQGRQAVAAPVIDHDYIFDNPVLGGEVSLTSNLTVLNRDKNDPFLVSGDTYYHGLAGTYVRDSHELQWQRKMIGPMGQVFTPFASLRGDLYSLDETGFVPSSLTDQSTPTRFMPAAGFEWSLPILAMAGNSTHVIEPIAQIVVRPNEPLAGQLPNDDAQSLVFDDTTLFSRDKFSGYDRVEGGTRANIGVRYVGTFGNGSQLEGVFGQSYAVAGQNSFAVTDIANVGPFTGLESDVSDYVGRVSYDTAGGTRFLMRGRFDDRDFTVNAAEVGAGTTIGKVTTSATYLYVRQIPAAGILTPTSQATANVSVGLIENWRVFGSAVYDFQNTKLASDSVGVAFDNSCLSLSINYTETRGTDIPDRKLMLRLLLRTLAEGSVQANVSSFGSN